VTPFSRIWLQPSGNTGPSACDPLSMPCHDANWREHAESKARNTDALPTYFMIASVEIFFLTWGPALLKCYGPHATLIRHCVCSTSQSWINYNLWWP